jgi:hypothetical protein
MNCLFLYRPIPNLYGSDRYTRVDFMYNHIRRLVWNKGLPFIKSFPSCLNHPIFKALQNLSNSF